MADEFDGYGYGHIDAPAAADRMLLWTAPNAGGHSRRDEFLWKNGSTFEGLRATDGDVLDIGKTGGQRLRLFVSDTTIGFFNVAGAGAGRDGIQIRSDAIGLDINASEVARFDANGLYAKTAEVPIFSQERSGVLAWHLGGSGVGGDNSWNLRLNASTPAITATTANNIGVGVSPAVRLHAKSSGEIMRLETTTARGGGGARMEFHDPTGRKAYFGYVSDDSMYIMSDIGGMYLGTSAAIRWTINSTAFYPFTDNVTDIAGPSNRVKNLYLVNSPTVTSDEREKTWRGAPSEAELAAARRIIGELGFYQWNSTLAQEGDRARYHFGARAQQVWSIMADEGLIDAIVEGERPSSKYAFLCFDEWDEESRPVMEEVEVQKTRTIQRPSAILDPVTGAPAMVDEEETYTELEWRPTGESEIVREAGSRFGIRPDQLTMFLIAAQEARLAALEGA